VKYRVQLGWRGVWPELELNLSAVYGRSVLEGGREMGDLVSVPAVTEKVSSSASGAGSR
jgi:hypothetical protein